MTRCKSGLPQVTAAYRGTRQSVYPSPCKLGNLIKDGTYSYMSYMSRFLHAIHVGILICNANITSAVGRDLQSEANVSERDHVIYNVMFLSGYK